MPNLFLEHRMKMIQQRITPPLAGCIVTLLVRDTPPLLPIIRHRRGLGLQAAGGARGRGRA